MPAPPRMPFLKHGLRRFGTNRTGSAAIEFALVAPLFFALIFAIVEVAMMFFASQILESGTRDAARGLFTHQIQDQTASIDETRQTFQQSLCDGVRTLLTCNSVLVDVRSYPAGAAFTVPPLFDTAGNAITGNFAFQIPDANSSNIVVVRTFYRWPLFVTGLGFSLVNNGTDKRLLSSTAAFRVEPS
jgi:Flp pilus assembly protein TadG